MRWRIGYSGFNHKSEIIVLSHEEDNSVFWILGTEKNGEGWRVCGLLGFGNRKEWQVTRMKRSGIRSKLQLTAQDDICSICHHEAHSIESDGASFSNYNRLVQGLQAKTRNSTAHLNGAWWHGNPWLHARDQPFLGASILRV
jgi:hypothetical protein